MKREVQYIENECKERGRKKKAIKGEMMELEVCIFPESQKWRGFTPKGVRNGDGLTVANVITF